MDTSFYVSGDIVSSTLATAVVATLAAGLLCALGLSWTAARWRPSVALASVALLASCAMYLQSLGIWHGAGSLSAAPRYVGYFSSQPALVAAVFVFARQSGPVPVGVFWRMLVAAALMVLSRYLGDALVFDPTLGALLSMAFWIYILGELYFGPMSSAVRTASRPIRLGYFWVRLIMTIGWAIYPILHFVDVVIGVGHVPSIIVLYSIADVTNLLTISLIFMAVAGQERY